MAALGEALFGITMSCKKIYVYVLEQKIELTAAAHEITVGTEIGETKVVGKELIPQVRTMGNSMCMLSRMEKHDSDLCALYG